MRKALIVLGVAATLVTPFHSRSTGDDHELFKKVRVLEGTVERHEKRIEQLEQFAFGRTFSPPVPRSPSSKHIQCLANDASGRRCREMASGEFGLCAKHAPANEEPKQVAEAEASGKPTPRSAGSADPFATYCSGKKKDGSACGVLTCTADGYCSEHRPVPETPLAQPTENKPKRESTQETEGSYPDSRRCRSKDSEGNRCMTLTWSDTRLCEAHRNPFGEGALAERRRKIYLGHLVDTCAENPEGKLADNRKEAKVRAERDWAMLRILPTEDPTAWKEPLKRKKGGSSSRVRLSRRCSGITQKGTRCKRRTRSTSGRCWQH